MRPTRALGFLALSALGFPGRLSAWQEGGEGGAPPPAQEGEEPEAKKDGDEKDAKYFAIAGGDVYTGTGSILRGATVLARNGKIAEIGYDVVLPEGTTTLDAAGLRVYPGLIALGATSRVSSGLGTAEEPGTGADEHGVEHDDERLEPEIEILLDGLLPVPLRARDPRSEPPDEAKEPKEERRDEFQAEEEGEEKKSEIEDTFDPFNSFLVLALATGITTVQQSSAAVKLKRYEIDGVLLSDRRMATIPWDLGNPGGIKATRDKFARAAAYQRELRAWRERKAKDEKEPSRKGVDTTANRVLSGEALAHFRASRREELLGIARFAQEYGFRPVIEGCEEGWTVADELGRAGAYAILTPRHRMPKDERFVRAGGASIENAAVLFRSGVQIAVRPDSTSIDFIGTAGRDLLHLPVEAGFAVRGGLPDEAALAAMTIVPARVLGIDHRVGSLERGKDCDAIVTDGDILHYQTFVQYAVVDGKLVYEKEKELYFAHIRPRPKKPEAPAAIGGEPAPEPGEKAEEKAAPEEEAKKEEGREQEEKTEEKDEKKDDESDGGDGGRRD
jgi:imidazolonepropionase-like amidohydrolase